MKKKIALGIVALSVFANSVFGNVYPVYLYADESLPVEIQTSAVTEPDISVDDESVLRDVISTTTGSALTINITENIILTEPISINKSLELTLVSDGQKTITAAEGKRHVNVKGGNFVYNGTNVILDGNNKGGGIAYNGSIAGKFVFNGGTIQNCYTTGDGGAIASNCPIQFYDGLLLNNKAEGNGGGIYQVYGPIELWGGTIQGNTATSGGGVHLGILGQSGGHVRAFGTNIIGNTATTIGGGIYGVYTVYVTKGEIKDNNAQNGGGIYSQEYPIIEGGTISNNTASADGGGLYSPQTKPVYGDNSAAPIRGGTITGNKAGGNGGGVYCAAGVVMSGGEVSDNSAEGNGAGIFAMKQATIGGGIISNNKSSANGGGVYAKWNVLMTGGEVSKNTAIDGAGVYGGMGFNMTGGKISDNTATGNGGGIWASKVEWTNDGYDIVGGTIDGNTATNGGGLYTNTNLSFSGSTDLFPTMANVSNNTATENGGGIYVTGYGAIGGGNFTDNKANGNGGAVYSTGTGNGWNAVSFGISGGKFNKNSAVNGGAVYIGNGSKKTDNICGAIFTENTATENGGAVYTNKAITFSTTNLGGGYTPGAKFESNVAVLDGGAIYATEVSKVSFPVGTYDDEENPEGVKFYTNKARNYIYFNANTDEKEKLANYSGILHYSYAVEEDEDTNGKLGGNPDPVFFNNPFNNYDLNYTKADFENALGVTNTVEKTIVVKYVDEETREVIKDYEVSTYIKHLIPEEFLVTVVGWIDTTQLQKTIEEADWNWEISHEVVEKYLKNLSTGSDEAYIEIPYKNKAMVEIQYVDKATGDVLKTKGKEAVLTGFDLEAFLQNELDNSFAIDGNNYTIDNTDVASYEKQLKQKPLYIKIPYNKVVNSKLVDVIFVDSSNGAEIKRTQKATEQIEQLDINEFLKEYLVGFEKDGTNWILASTDVNSYVKDLKSDTAEPFVKIPFVAQINSKLVDVIFVDSSNGAEIKRTQKATEQIEQLDLNEFLKEYLVGFEQDGTNWILASTDVNSYVKNLNEDTAEPFVKIPFVVQINSKLVDVIFVDSSNGAEIKRIQKAIEQIEQLDINEFLKEYLVGFEQDGTNWILASKDVNSYVKDLNGDTAEPFVKIPFKVQFSNNGGGETDDDDEGNDNNDDTTIDTNNPIITSPPITEPPKEITTRPIENSPNTVEVLDENDTPLGIFTIPEGKTIEDFDDVEILQDMTPLGTVTADKTDVPLGDKVNPKTGDVTSNPMVATVVIGLAAIVLVLIKKRKCQNEW